MAVLLSLPVLHVLKLDNFFFCCCHSFDGQFALFPLNGCDIAVINPVFQFSYLLLNEKKKKKKMSQATQSYEFETVMISHCSPRLATEIYNIRKYGICSELPILD